MSPSVGFSCPDGECVLFDMCFDKCRLGTRPCGTLAYLRSISYDREWRGITPSMAGDGPRLIHLKRTCDYFISPSGRAFAALGTGVHGKLSIHAYTNNILSEEPLSDEQTKGIPDCLEQDEEWWGYYVLTDYKTWGSFKVAKALGIVKHTEDVPILDGNGNKILLKSGPNQGKAKTKQRVKFVRDPGAIDIYDTALQLNRYKIMFELAGFPVSKIQVQAIVRDGGIYLAKSRGIESNICMIPVPFLADEEVLAYYEELSLGVKHAFHVGTVRKCNAWESWDGRRCDGYCEVKSYCDEMEVG